MCAAGRLQESSPLHSDGVSQSCQPLYTPFSASPCRSKGGVCEHSLRYLSLHTSCTSRSANWPQRTLNQHREPTSDVDRGEGK
eukprot:scaffold26501_cov35-Tisochrysis_lutea.AAC.1